MGREGRRESVQRMLLTRRCGVAVMHFKDIFFLFLESCDECWSLLVVVLRLMDPQYGVSYARCDGLILDVFW